MGVKKVRNDFKQADADLLGNARWAGQGSARG